MLVKKLEEHVKRLKGARPTGVHTGLHACEGCSYVAQICSCVEQSSCLSRQADLSLHFAESHSMQK